MTLKRARISDAAFRRRGIPELVNGDHLKQPEFHRRYEAMPDDFKAELIGGIVYVASPLRTPHGRHSAHLAGLLAAYEAATPGVECADNITVILDDESEPQPDLCLRIKAEYGGQSREDENQYLRGSPELIVEIAHSTEAIDLGVKLQDYRRAGLREYAVYCVSPGELHTFVFPSEKKSVFKRGEVYRSTQFPGLWIDVAALADKDAQRLLASGRAGIASTEHDRFAARLAKRAKPRKTSRPRRKTPRRRK
jgi:Uma2 family endonuclease